MPTTEKPAPKQSADPQTATPPTPASSAKPTDDQIADALDPATGTGVQDVVQVPSVLKTGQPDQTPAHVVMDPEAAQAADEARRDSALPADPA